VSSFPLMMGNQPVDSQPQITRLFRPCWFF
jgi:hypothetical protein